MITSAQYQSLLAQPNLTPGMAEALRTVPYTKEGAFLGGFDRWNDQGVSGNRTVIGDIAGLIATGGTPTDANWASAGYGPGGASRVSNYAQVSFAMNQIQPPTPYRPTPPMGFAPVQPINFLALFGGGGYVAPSQITPYIPKNYTFNWF